MIDPLVQQALDDDPNGVVVSRVPTGPAVLGQVPHDVLMEYLFISIQEHELTRAASLMMYFINERILINPEVVNLLVQRINQTGGNDGFEALLTAAALSGSEIPFQALPPDVATEIHDIVPRGGPISISEGVLAYGTFLRQQLLPPLPAQRRISRSRRMGFRPRNTL